MERGFPGEDLVARGAADLAEGVYSLASLVVEIGYPRLVRAGLDLAPPRQDSPEHRLYELLSRSDAATAHSRYNALIRRLVSYERAAECAS